MTIDSLSLLRVSSSLSNELTINNNYMIATLMCLLTVATRAVQSLLYMAHSLFVRVYLWLAN